MQNETPESSTSPAFLLGLIYPRINVPAICLQSAITLAAIARRKFVRTSKASTSSCPQYWVGRRCQYTILRQSLQAIFFLSILTNRAFMRIIKTESILRQQPSEIPWIYLSKWPSSVSAGGGHFLFLWGVGQNFYLPDLEICLIIGSRIRRSRRDPNL